MAKLTARGEHKVAEARKNVTHEDCSTSTWVLALRSDGKILSRAITRNQYGKSYGAYSIVASVRKDADIRHVFARYAESRGYVVVDN